MEFDCFLCGKELLCMDSTAHKMKGLTRDQVLSMHHLTKDQPTTRQDTLEYLQDYQSIYGGRIDNDFDQIRDAHSFN